MASTIYDPLADAWLSLLIGVNGFASLHYEIPDPADPAASEITGPTYSRSPLIWDYAKDTGRTVWNIQDLSWVNLDAVTIVGLGFWSDPTKGDLLVFAQLDEPVPVPDRGSYLLAANQWFVHV